MTIKIDQNKFLSLYNPLTEVKSQEGKFNEGHEKYT